MADTLQDNSEQAPADLEVRDSEERFRTAFSQSPIAIGLYDPNGRLIEANASCLDLFGVADAETIRGFKLFEHPNLPDDEKRRLLAGQPVYLEFEFDFERVRKMGWYATTRSGRCHLGCFISPWQTAALGPGGYLAHVRDITERKRAEEELRERGERLRAIFEASRDAIFIKDRARRYTHVNPAMQPYLGFSASELVGRTYDELFGEEAGAAVRQADTRVLAGEPIEEEITNPVGGIPTTFHVSKAPLRDHSGDVIGLCGIARDVTERVRAEKALQQERDTARRYLDTVEVVLLALDEKGQIILLNRKGYSILGYDEGELLGNDWFDACLPARGREDMRQVFLTLMSGEVEPVERYENPVLTRSGEERIVAWYNVLLTDETGHITGTLSSGHDVTERVRAEKEIRRLNTELELRVYERTAQLQAANEQLEAFAYSVAHDLRAPLRAIRGFGEIIARRHLQSLSPEGQHYLDNIIQATGQMGRLIDDLLAYSRLGRSSVASTPVQLDRLLAQVKENLADRVAETGAHVTIPADAPEIMGDRTLLKGIFTNLLENALTYHRPGVPPRVDVTCQTGADHVMVRVTDNGIGIPLEFQEKIFEVFQRLHDQDEHPGTGIGLAIVAKSVELLGGRVRVHSVVDRGSTFEVQLPTT